MAIEWNPNLETGIEEIDRQHKKLFESVNKLLDACNKGRGHEEVGATVTFLGNYIIEHFDAEEDFMLKNGYPQYPAHSRIHRDFLKEYDDLKKEFENEGPTLNFVLKINHVVVGWLMEHIGKTDKKFAKYLNSK